MAHDDGFVNIPSDPVIVPGPPDDSGPTPREMIIRGLSAHKMRRLDDLLASGMNTGDIAIALSIQSSVIAMYVSRREAFDAVRANADPRNLGGAPTAPASGGGYNYRPGVTRGS
jgi:hypothetical protein